MLQINAGSLDGDHPFPDRVHVSVLFATFQLELTDLIGRRVDFARSEIDGWPSTGGLGMTEPTRELLECITAGWSVLAANGEVDGEHGAGPVPSEL